MKVYFRVPNFTGYGPNFDTWAEALAYTAERWTSPLVRQFIDVREADDSGDRIVKRYSIPNPTA